MATLENIPMTNHPEILEKEVDHLDQVKIQTRQNLDRIRFVINFRTLAHVVLENRENLVTVVMEINPQPQLLHQMLEVNRLVTHSETQDRALEGIAVNLVMIVPVGTNRRRKLLHRILEVSRLATHFETLGHASEVIAANLVMIVAVGTHPQHEEIDEVTGVVDEIVEEGEKATLDGVTAAAIVPEVGRIQPQAMMAGVVNQLLHQEHGERQLQQNNGEAHHLLRQGHGELRLRQSHGVHQVKVPQLLLLQIPLRRISIAPHLLTREVNHHAIHSETLDHVVLVIAESSAMMVPVGTPSQAEGTLENHVEGDEIAEEDEIIEVEERVTQIGIIVHQVALVHGKMQPLATMHGERQQLPHQALGDLTPKQSPGAQTVHLLHLLLLRNPLLVLVPVPNLHAANFKMDHADTEIHVSSAIVVPARARHLAEVIQEESGEEEVVEIIEVDEIVVVEEAAIRVADGQIQLQETMDGARNLPQNKDLGDHPQPKVHGVQHHRPLRAHPDHGEHRHKPLLAHQDLGELLNPLSNGEDLLQFHKRH